MVLDLTKGPLRSVAGVRQLLPQHAQLPSPRLGGFGSFGRELQPDVRERVPHRHRPFLLDGVGDRSQQGDDHLWWVRLNDDHLTRGRQTRLPGLDEVANRFGALAEPLLDQVTASIDP